MTRTARSARPCGAFLAALVAAIAVAGLLAPAPAAAQERKFPGPDERAAEWELAFGGKLYDNWFAATFAPPLERMNPLAPEDVTIAPAASWRCVTCHGYDYEGASLPRGDLRPPVPMPGLTHMRGRDPKNIAAYLRRPPHRIGRDMMTDAALDLLARFVAEGQVEIADYMEFEDEHAAGRPIFQGVCISCHEADGLAYIEGEPGDKASLGWLARNRPAQVVHKIVNGQPGSDMVSLRFLSQFQVGALFAYLRTLPDPE